MDKHMVQAIRDLSRSGTFCISNIDFAPDYLYAVTRKADLRKGLVDLRTREVLCPCVWRRIGIYVRESRPGSLPCLPETGDLTKATIWIDWSGLAIESGREIYHARKGGFP